MSLVVEVGRVTSGWATTRPQWNNQQRNVVWRYSLIMHRNKRTRIYLLFLFALACPAQTWQEAEPVCSAKSADKVEIAPADTKFLGFTIGHSTLKDVQARLGPANVVTVSPGGADSDQSVCYFSPSDGTVVIFYTGPMGGWRDITWFAIWSQKAAFPKRAECSPSKVVSRTLSIASGVRLGLSRAEFERLAGVPTQRKPAIDEYSYLCRRRMTAEEIRGFKTANGWNVTSDPYFDRTSWIKAWFRDSGTSRIDIGEVESY